MNDPFMEIADELDAEEARLRGIASAVEAGSDLAAAALDEAMAKPIPGGDAPVAPSASAGLPMFTAASLADRAAPPRQWLIEGIIPAHTVTLLNGDGGTGKSLVALQLAWAVATDSPWLGMSAAPGTALFLTAEDSADEVHRRLEVVSRETAIALHGANRLNLVSLAACDALLAVPDMRAGALRPTLRYAQVEAAITAMKPRLVVLDTLADLFGGEENDRAQARQFIALLRHLALRHQTTILLLAHPSLQGMASGSGSSGSTAWNNSVRSRLYLERVKDETGAEIDPDLRIMRVVKANYGRTGAEYRIRWQAGVFVCNQPSGGLSEMAAYAARENADRVFLQLLGIYEGEGRPVSSTRSANYAPAVFAKDTRSEALGARSLADAMNRLFAKGLIRVEETGPPSKRRQRLVAAPRMQPGD